MDITQRKITKIAREAEKLVLLTVREEGVGTAEIDLIHALQDAPNDRRSQLLFPTEKAENLKSSKAEVEAAFYEYLTGVLTQEEAAAFAAALNKLYTASKTESRAGFPHFRNTAGGETARGTTD